MSLMVGVGNLLVEVLWVESLHSAESNLLVLVRRGGS
jgi:hypothetical protein